MTFYEIGTQLTSKENGSLSSERLGLAFFIPTTLCCMLYVTEVLNKYC